jgi:ATP-dependent protease HslVU (ClpYQ) peptidase subunit
MTTIAWDGITLATDSQCTYGESVMSHEYQKIFKNVGIFDAAAITGDPDACIGYLTALSQVSSLTEIPIPDEEKVTVIVVLEDTAYCIYTGGYNSVVAPWAFGSGQEYAIAAMDHGKTAAQAVKYASTRCIFTNSRIQTYKAKRRG